MNHWEMLNNSETILALAKAWPTIAGRQNQISRPKGVQSVGSRRYGVPIAIGIAT